MAGLETEIPQLVREYKARTGQSLTIGTVESATGGRIADLLTSVPGSSEYFKGSIVAYADEVKTALLGVGTDTIAQFGAVSEQTAVAMAEAGRRLLCVDLCVSDSGIAGPSGATDDKPVGLFYLGLATRDLSSSKRHVFGGDRERNKKRAAEAALIMLKHYLLRCLGREGLES
jgi:PncC family amidohydrolase